MSNIDSYSTRDYYVVLSLEKLYLDYKAYMDLMCYSLIIHGLMMLYI